jgi:hypothetical protein
MIEADEWPLSFRMWLVSLRWSGMVPMPLQESSCRYGH